MGPPGGPLTVVMPAYNEEEAIESAVKEVQELVLDEVPGSRLIVVNDGSTDRTGEILDRLALDDSRLRLVHQPNGGHGAAIMTGLKLARGEYVFLIDSDLQIPLRAFPPLWEAARGKDGAFGVRFNRHDPALRLKLTKVIRQVVRILFRVNIYDANVPFKIVRRSAWENARRLIPDGTLTPSLFLALFMKRNRMVIEERHVEHLERATGEVSVNRWTLFKFCAKAFVQLLEFHRRLYT